jgi:hypothetical protein
MAHRTKGSVLSQVQSERQRLAGSEGLPFQRLLSGERIRAALERANVSFRERIYTPTITLWAFLSQVAAGQEASCEDAVSRVAANRVANGKPPCSLDTNSYCTARQRVPERVYSELARETGQELHREALPQWLWKGRRVVIVDGSTASMADTENNQAAYPQSTNQTPGLGFPLLRFVVLLSLSVGTVLECAMGSCHGKKTGEQSLFRRTWDALEGGEIVLGDRLYDAYRDIALLKARGVDSVMGKKQSRHVDFRTGRKLGPHDHAVVWKKPNYDRTRYESREEWESLPKEMEMREVRVIVRRPGFKKRTVDVVTTLLNERVHSSRDITDLFAQRWHCELDLRSIKRTLGMHHLRCKTPDMVRKELWTHLLAYNLIRVRMAQAAAVHGGTPRTLSFAAAKTHVHHFADHSIRLSSTDQQRVERELLHAIAACRVGQRPHRKEPRAVKKRKQKYSFLTKPRVLARKRLAA